MPLNTRCLFCISPILTDRPEVAEAWRLITSYALDDCGEEKHEVQRGLPHERRRARRCLSSFSDRFCVTLPKLTLPSGSRRMTPARWRSWDAAHTRSASRATTTPWYTSRDWSRVARTNTRS